MHAHTIAARVVVHTTGEPRLGEAFGKVRRMLEAVEGVVKVEILDGECGLRTDVVSFEKSDDDVG